MFRYARGVLGTNWKRINVQTEVWYSPAPPKKRKNEFETEIQQPTSKDERQLATSYISKQSERYTLPVENLVRSKEEQIRKKEAEITTKTHEIESLEQSFSQRPIDSTRTACTKCHLRASHKRANCVNECCTTARLCGDMKSHPEEKRQIKDLKTDPQLLKSKHKRLKEERDSLLENMQSMQAFPLGCVNGLASWKKFKHSTVLLASLRVLAYITPLSPLKKLSVTFGVCVLLVIPVQSCPFIECPYFGLAQSSNLKPAASKNLTRNGSAVVMKLM